MIKHNKHFIQHIQLQNRIFWVLVFFALVGLVLYITRPSVISPCSDSGCQSVQYIPQETLDTMVHDYSYKYGKTSYERNRIKAMLHYLLLREQNYGGSEACGDGGKACGPLQFHEPTYISYRKIMIKRGLVNDMGSRLDMEDAIETTAWAIADGRERAWGPIARGEIQL
jgi:hypothetical protein